MTADLSAPPFTLDVRVARSPLVGLRYGVDGRATDIDDLVERLEAAHAAASAERDEIRTRLKPYDANHRVILQRLTRGSGGQYRQRLEEGLELRTELARVDERLVCLRERIDEPARAARDTRRSCASRWRLCPPSTGQPSTVRARQPTRRFASSSISSTWTTRAPPRTSSKGRCSSSPTPRCTPS